MRSVRLHVILIGAFSLIAWHAPAASQDDARGSFTEWLAGVRTEALGRGIREEVVDQALATAEAPIPVVIERDRSQAETVLPLEQYISVRVTAKAASTARDRLAKNRDLLDKIAAQYGVAPALVVSVWGSESDFGKVTGARPTIGALATLAYDQRRPALFRRELFSALEILNRGDIELANMRGSWAGAMGQPQFMPSSYLAFAEDFDGDGRRDIWGTPADVFASIANFLKGHGWVSGARWGREVKVSPEAAGRIAEVGNRSGSCRATREMTVALPLKDWREMGVQFADGRPLPDADQMASLVSGTSRRFLVYENYDALLSYNCAHAYALSVALLSDRVATP